MRYSIGIGLIAAVLAGCEGPAGPAGTKGADGVDGANGADGVDGVDGATGADGVDGADGADGADGQDATLDPLLSPLDKALVGIGGQANLEALTGFVVTASGTDGIGGEGFTPSTFQPAVSLFDTVTSADLGSGAFRVDVSRENWFFGAPIAQTFSEVVSGEVGEVQGTESILGFPTAMTSDRLASIARDQRFLNPHLILRAVAADPGLASDGGDALLDGSVHHLLVVADDVAPITLWVNAANGHIDQLSTTEGDPAYSDVPVQVFYYGWTLSTGALLFPADVYVAVDGQIVHHEERTATVEVNPALAGDTFDLLGTPVPYDGALAAHGEQSAQFHQQFAGVGIPLDGFQTAVVPTEISPGVWHLTTASHHSLVVEQTSGLVLFDAPLYPELAEVVIDWAATQFPGKPFTHVVVSHHHRDHIGGLRALVAAGATVVVHDSVQGYYQDLFTRPRTIQPDALAAAPVAATFELVPDGGSVTLDDAVHPIDVWSIANFHAQDLLVPVVRGDTAFTVDIYSPGFGVNPLALAVYDALDGQGVQTLAGGHGFGTQTWDGFVAELEAAGLL